MRELLSDYPLHFFECSDCGRFFGFGDDRVFENFEAQGYPTCVCGGMIQSRYGCACIALDRRMAGETRV